MCWYFLRSWPWVRKWILWPEHYTLSVECVKLKLFHDIWTAGLKLIIFLIFDPKPHLELTRNAKVAWRWMQLHRKTQQYFPQMNFKQQQEYIFWNTVRSTTHQYLCCQKINREMTSLTVTVPMHVLRIDVAGTWHVKDLFYFRTVLPVFGGAEVPEIESKKPCGTRRYIQFSTSRQIVTQNKIENVYNYYEIKSSSFHLFRF